MFTSVTFLLINFSFLLNTLLLPPSESKRREEGLSFFFFCLFSVVIFELLCSLSYQHAVITPTR